MTVIPEVQLIASSIKASIGNTITLFCNVIRTNPKTISYTWIHQNRRIVFESNLDSLVLTFALDEDFGNYTCIVRNAANISGSAHVTIERGCKNMK